MEEEITNDFFTEEEYGCTFVAGYTSWGFPYGTTIEEPEAIKDNEELPKKKTERIAMSSNNSSSNRINVPEAKQAMDQFKMPTHQ